MTDVGYVTHSSALLLRRRQIAVHEQKMEREKNTKADTALNRAVVAVVLPLLHCGRERDDELEIRPRRKIFCRVH